MSNEPNRSEINLLPQGEKLESFFGMGYELFAEPRLQPFKVTISYTDFYGKQMCNASYLDISQFDGFIILGKPAEQDIADTLKKIERHIGHVMTGFKRLKIETITEFEARAQQTMQMEDARRELKKRQNQENM